MIMNLLGKSLVLVQLALSVAFLGWAAAIFAYPVDLGWKEPRRAWVDPPEGKKDNERIASEIDKRAAAVKKAAEAKQRALARVELAQKDLVDAEHKFWRYHLAYRAEIASLKSADGKITVRNILFEGGLPKLDAKSSTGLAYEKPLAVDLSLVKLFDLMKARQDEIKKVQEAIKNNLAEETRLTRYLTGKDENDKQANPGLYGLLDEEATKQRKFKEEYDYLQPLWVRELNAAQILLDRRAKLERRLKELGVGLE